MCVEQDNIFSFCCSSIITIVAYILHKTNYGSIYKSEFILQLRYNGGAENETSYLRILIVTVAFQLY